MVAVAALAAASRVQAQAEGQPLAVVAVNSYDQLVQDIDFLGGLIGQPQASQQLDMMLNLFTQNQGLAGLDKSRPLGVVSQVIGTGPMFAICLPVNDQNALLGVAKGFGVTTQDMGNGITQISVMGQDLYAKNTGGWSLVSIVPDALSGVPADPGAVLAPLTADYDVAVQINVQSLPEAMRQMVLETMANAARAGIRQGPSESDAEFAARQQTMETDIAAQQQMIRELDQFLVGAAIDSRGNRVYVDVQYTALPDTKLAEQLAVNRDTTTNYAGFLQPGAAITFIAAPKLAGVQSGQIEQLINNLRFQVDQAIETEVELKNPESRDKMKAAIGDFLDALRASLDSGQLDIGAVLHVSPDAVTLVAGGAAADPTKVEAGLKKLSEVAAREGLEMPEIKWNAENYNGIQFHVMEHPTKKDNAVQQRLLGETVPIAVGIGRDSAYFAFGKNWLETVKKVIDDSAAEPGKAVPPMDLTVSLTPILQTAAAVSPGAQQAQLEAVAQMLSGDAAGRDHVRMFAQPIDNGMRIRFEAEDGVLKAIGAGAMGQAPAAAIGPVGALAPR
jgi:hypothetical protein